MPSEIALAPIDDQTPPHIFEPVIAACIVENQSRNGETGARIDFVFACDSLPVHCIKADEQCFVGRRANETRQQFTDREAILALDALVFLEESRIAPP